MTNQMEPEPAVRLSVQRALVGAVGPSLYGACVDVQGNVIVLTLYVSAETPEDERDDLGVVGAEMIADFPDFRIDDRFVEVTDPTVPLPTAGSWVFLQRGFRAGAVTQAANRQE